MCVFMTVEQKVFRCFFWMATSQAMQTFYLLESMQVVVEGNMFYSELKDNASVSSQ